MNSRRFQAEVGTHASGALLLPLQNTNKTTPNDDNNDQCLIDSDISLFSEGPDLENMQELKTWLAWRRSSLSHSRFSEEDFKNFKRNSTKAMTEGKATTNVLQMMKGSSAIFFCQKNNLVPLNVKLAATKPDFYRIPYHTGCSLKHKREHIQRVKEIDGWVYLFNWMGLNKDGGQVKLGRKSWIDEDGWSWWDQLLDQHKYEYCICSSRSIALFVHRSPFTVHE